MTGNRPPEPPASQGTGRIWSSRGIPRWGWWAMMLLPMMFILAGSVMLIDGLIFAARAERALATVVSVERITSTVGSSRAPSHSYRPTLSYADALGVSHQAVTHISAGHYGYAPGERVEILYDPAEPGTVRIAGFFALWGLPLIFVGPGLAFLMVVRLVRRKVSPPAARAPGTVMRR